MSLTDSHTGFFGKVRSHGDFVTRRLPVSFTRIWDDWLQASLHASRDHLGPLWLKTYLNSPIWRFALAPGACGAQAWAGVLMPSVDRVGRHFPLTIAASVLGTTPLLEWMAETGAWYDQLETLALSALQDDFTLDKFDANLSLIRAPLEATVSTNEYNVAAQGQSIAHVMALENLDHLKDAIPQLSWAITAASLRGHSLWWTEGSQQIAPNVLVHKGLPTASLFPAMLDGQWLAHGWHDVGIAKSGHSSATQTTTQHE